MGLDQYLLIIFKELPNKNFKCQDKLFAGAESIKICLKLNQNSWNPKIKVVFSDKKKTIFEKGCVNFF